MATTMQEYLEEVARRQATGWTPGVPTMPRVSTTWNLPPTARTTMRQAVPKANLGDISAQSNPQSTTKRRGRPRTTPEKLQSISDRAGTGTIKPMLGAISKIAGPAGIAAELLRSEPAVASELAPGTIPGDFRVTQAYPSMAVEEGYPNVSTLPSFDVTPDAGGAIGGVPGVQPMEKYGPSGYEGERIPPTGYRQIAPDTVIAASDFEVGPTSMASTGLYSEAGVPMSNENLSFFGAAPVPTSPSMRVSSSDDSPWSGVRDIWSDYADKVSTPTTSSADQFAGLSFSDKKDILMDSVDKINKMGNAGMLPAPTDFSSPFMSLWSHPTMTSQNAAYSQGLKQLLAGDRFGSFLG